MYNAGRQYGLGSARQRNIRDRTKSIMGRYAEKIDSSFSKRGVDVYGNKPISRRVIWVTITVKIMIGDFILWIRNVLKQNLFCVHHYVWKGSVMFSEFRYEQCEKCGKLKK